MYVGNNSIRPILSDIFDGLKNRITPKTSIFDIINNETVHQRNVENSLDKATIKLKEILENTEERRVVRLWREITDPKLLSARETLRKVKGYHPATEAYRDILKDGSNSTVVILGAGCRGLNPFFAFPDVSKAIIVDWNSDCNNVDEILREIALDGKIVRKNLDNETVEYRYFLPYDTVSEKTLIHVSKDYSTEETYHKVCSVAGNQPIKALVQGSATGSYMSLGVKLLASNVKENRGCIVNEAFYSCPNGATPFLWSSEKSPTSKTGINSGWFAEEKNDVEEFYGSKNSILINWSNKTPNNFVLIVDFQPLWNDKECGSVT